MRFAAGIVEAARIRGFGALFVALAAFGLVVLHAGTAFSTPDPTAVTVAGSLQSEAGCAGDWDPACAATHLVFDANDDVWQGTFSLPAGSYEYKAALNDSWSENYGLNGLLNGSNVPFNLASGANVKFYYDHKSHWITDNVSSVIAVAAGSFQSELGCSGDWDPSCLRSWLEDADGDGTYTFETTALPVGSYDTKVAISEDWAENYGQGGVSNGSNIPFTVPVDHARVTFSYVASTHVLTVTVADPQGAPGSLSHFDLARKDCLGTARNTTSKVWFTVAGGVLSDVYYPTIDNTNVETLRYVVTDGATFTDLQGRDTAYSVDSLGGTAGMGCRVTTIPANGKYRIVTDYVTDPGTNALLMKVSFKPKNPADHLQLYLRFDPTVNGNGGGGSGNGGADDAVTDTSTGHPVLVASDPNTVTNAANRDYAQPVYEALDAPLADTTNGFAGAASDGLVELDAGHGLTTSYASATDGNVVQTGRIAGTADRNGSLVFTAALGFGSTQATAVQTAERALTDTFGKALNDTERGWQRYDMALRGPDREASGSRREARRCAAGLLLRERQRPEGVRGQDVSRRDRRGAGVPVGPGHPGRRPVEHLLRLVPRGLRARLVRDLDRPDG